MIRRLLSSNTFLLVLLVAISAYAWRLLPEQVIRGDGFVYLITKTQQEFFARDFFYTGFELSAASFGWLFSRLYGINISWYWWTAYVVMLVTHALFYWFALTIFKKPLLAFVASIVFALNFFGNWDLYSSHCYCFFIERIIPVLFLLPSGVYLHRFLEKRRLRDGVISLTLYFLGIGIGHWSVFVTAFFLFYPICWALFPAKGKPKPRAATIGALYLGITIFFVLVQQVHESGFGLRWKVTDFLLRPQTYHWPALMLRQLVYWTEYPVILSGDFYSRMVDRMYDMTAIAAIMPTIALLYVVVFAFAWRLPKRRAILLTCVLGTASLFFINPLFGQYDVAHQPGANRYLYYPTVLLSLFWTVVIEMLMVGRGRVLKGIGIILLIGYVFVNMTLIRESFVESMRHNVWTKRVFDYIRTQATLQEKGTLIVAPYDEVGVYEAVFFTEQLAPKGIRVMSAQNTYPETSMWESVASQSALVYVLEKNKACRCIKERVLKQ